MRTAVGVLVGILFLGAIVYATLQENSVECEVCVRYQGREACNTSTAGDRDTSVMQATSSACARVASGVTDSIQCGGIQPARVSCR